jgi:hypothetical protein
MYRLHPINKALAELLRFNFRDNTGNRVIDRNAIDKKTLLLEPIVVTFSVIKYFRSPFSACYHATKGDKQDITQRIGNFS